MAADLTANLISSKPNSGSDVNTVMVPRGLPPEEAVQTSGSAQNGGSNSSSSNQKDLNEVVAQVQDHVQNIRRQLNFVVNNDIGKTVIQVTDSETHEVIRQIPSEEFIEIAKALEKTQSLLMKKTEV